jgi:hypothetical protein
MAGRVRADCGANLSCDQLSQRQGNLRRLIWFWKKAPASWPIGVRNIRFAGRDNEGDRRPALFHNPDQPQPIHGPGHLDIGEYGPNVISAFKDVNSVVCIRGADGCEPRLLPPSRLRRSAGGFRLLLRARTACHRIAFWHRHFCALRAYVGYKTLVEGDGSGLPLNIAENR